MADINAKVLVVGGGRIAHRKVQQLLMAEADVTVLAPSIIDELRGLAARVADRTAAAADREFTVRTPPTATARAPYSYFDQHIIRTDDGCYWVADEGDCQSASKKDPLSACKRDPLRQAA